MRARIAPPVAQQVEGDDRHHDDQGEDLEQCEAAADQPRRRRPQPSQRAARLIDGEVAQALVHHLRPQRFLQPLQPVAQQRADAGDVVRQALHQDADLREDQRIEQQRRDQRRGHQQEDQQEGRERPADAEPRQPRRHRIEEIGDHRRQHEGRQDALEQPQAEQQRRTQADYQRRALRTRRGARRGRRREARRGRRAGCGLGAGGRLRLVAQGAPSPVSRAACST